MIHNESEDAATLCSVQVQCESEVESVNKS